MEKYFKKFEVIGKTKDEAKNNATGLNLMVDATQAFNKWKKENITTEDNIKEWMKTYLANKKYDRAGLGAFIVLQPAVQDTRQRPYKIEKPKYEKRTHSFERFYVIREVGTDKEVAKVKNSKDAEKKVKDLITENNKSYDIFVEAKVKEGNSLYARGIYTPTKGAQPCKILAFGYLPLD